MSNEYIEWLNILKTNSLGSAVICILSALAYKKKISNSNIVVLHQEQTKLLGCLYLIVKEDDETIKNFCERKTFSIFQLQSLRTKILLERYRGNQDKLFESSFKAVSSKRMQLNILHVTEEIFKQSPALEWINDKKRPNKFKEQSFKEIEASVKNIPDKIWKYDLNIEELNILKRMKEFWSIELDGPFRYQEGQHKEGLKVVDYFELIDDINLQ